MNDTIKVIDNILMQYAKSKNKLEKELSKCSGRIDVKLSDYDTEDKPDIYIYDNIDKTEALILQNDLTNDLSIQVFCDSKLIYVE